MVTSVFWTSNAARGAPLMRHDAPLSWSPHSRAKSHVFPFSSLCPTTASFSLAPFGVVVSGSQLGYIINLHPSKKDGGWRRAQIRALLQSDRKAMFSGACQGMTHYYWCAYLK